MLTIFAAVMMASASSSPTPVDGPRAAPARVEAVGTATVRLLTAEVIRFDDRLTERQQARRTTVMLADGEHYAVLYEFQ